MARIRTIKPELPQSESMGRVSRESRLCFILLFTLADDAGRLRGNSRMLSSLLYPYDDDAKSHIDGWLSELNTEGCIVRYEIGGDHFIQIMKWAQHQKIDKPSASKIPEFVEGSRGFANVREDAFTPAEKKAADQGRDQGKDQGEVAKDFAQFWSSYPKKVGKPAAARAFRSAKASGHLVNILEDIGLRKSGDDWQKENGKYIPNPATYLNQRRWEDEVPSSGQPKSKPWDGAR